MLELRAGSRSAATAAISARLETEPSPPAARPECAWSRPLPNSRPALTTERTRAPAAARQTAQTESTAHAQRSARNRDFGWVARGRADPEPFAGKAYRELGNWARFAR